MPSTPLRLNCVKSSLCRRILNQRAPALAGLAATLARFRVRGHRCGTPRSPPLGFPATTFRYLSQVPYLRSDNHYGRFYMAAAPTASIARPALARRHGGGQQSCVCRAASFSGAGMADYAPWFAGTVGTKCAAPCALCAATCPTSQPRLPWLLTCAIRIAHRLCVSALTNRDAALWPWRAQPPGTRRACNATIEMRPYVGATGPRPTTPPKLWPRSRAQRTPMRPTPQPSNGIPTR